MRKMIFFIFSIAILTSFLLVFDSSNAIEKDTNVTEEMHHVISEYIMNNYKTEDDPEAKQFEAHTIYGTEEKDDIITVYLYSMYKEILTKEDRQPSHAYPVRIRLEKSGSSYVVIDYTKPEDGYYYPSSIEEMFPRKYARQALKDTGHTPHLTKQIDDKVAKWHEENNK